MESLIVKFANNALYQFYTNFTLFGFDMKLIITLSLWSNATKFFIEKVLHIFVYISNLKEYIMNGNASASGSK